MMGKKVIIQFLALGIAGVLAFLSLTLSARWFGPEIIGQVAYLSGLLGLVFGFSDLGLSRAEVHFTAANQGKPAAGFLLLKLILLSLCAVAALIVGQANRQLSWLFLILLVYEILFRLADSLLITFEGREKVWPQNLVRLTGKLAKLVMLIIFAFAWRTSAGYSLTFLAEAVLILVLTQIVGRGLWRLKPDPGVIKRYCQYSLPFALIIPFSYVQDNGLILLIRRFWSAEVLGVYAASLGIFGLLKSFSSSLMVFFFPRISRLNETKDIEQIQRYTDTAVKFSIYILLPLAVVLFAVSGWLVPLILGSRFIGAINIFRLWLIGILVLGIFSPYDHVLFATNNHRLIVKVNVLTTLIVLVLGWLLIPRLGGLGAAIAAVIGWLIGGFWQFTVLHRKTGIKFLNNWRLSRSEVKYLYGLLNSFGQAIFRGARKEAGSAKS